jgi:uncharacterized phage-associated protein
MAKIDDVAAEILSRTGPISTWKLQKLVYYCQAWHSVWEEEPLFDDKVEAWANGPVVPALYNQHRGVFTISAWPSGKPETLEDCERTTVDAVLKYYGDKSGQWLSDLTHRERPWREARIGLADGERGSNEITLEAMSEYYGGLNPDA